MKIKLLLASLLVVFVAACGAKNTDSAERSETIEKTGVIQSIDKDARRFVVKGGGKTATLRASEAVKNFDQLQVGDTIKLYYTESVAVSMATPGSDNDATLDVMTATAEPGDRPGVVDAEMLTVKVEFVAYNPNNHVATVKSLDGDRFDVDVKPEMRDFASARNAGELIEVQMLSAVAVIVEPVAAPAQ